MLSASLNKTLPSFLITEGDDSEEDDKKEEEDLDKQMGDIDQKDIDKLDEQLWGSDEEESPETEVTQMLT